MMCSSAQQRTVGCERAKVEDSAEGRRLNVFKPSASQIGSGGGKFGHGAAGCALRMQRSRKHGEWGAVCDVARDEEVSK